jgi:tRNA(Ile)-lysidine synthase
VLGPEAATGHTADDQAETVMVNLLRGAGVSGLAGMRAGPRHPVLALRRRETVALCRRLDLEPVHDPTNDHPRFLRNRVRHELLPLCSDIAGRDVVPLLARQAGLLAADADLLDAVSGLVDPEDAAALSAAPEAVARRSLRSWLSGVDGYPPPFDAVQRVLEVARHQRVATELPGGRRVTRSRGRLSVSAEPVHRGAPDGHS